jgi:pSer/pThr/pTyr-binding forkhead associated (FHA) protein
MGHDVVSKRLPKVDIRPIWPPAKAPETSKVTVGRDKKSDIRIAHPRVSSMHACFTINGGLLSLSDVGSKNGTGVNGSPLPAHKVVPVDVGDTIRFGPVSATIWGLDDVVAAIGTSRF